MCRAYIFKIVRSPLTYLAIIGVAAVFATNFLNGLAGSSDVVNHLDVFLGLDAFRKIIAVMSALPFAANFAEEWNSSVTANCITRKNVGKYAGTNVVFCWITSFLAVFLGMMIFVEIYTFILPLYKPNPNPKVTPYGIFLDSGMPIIYVLARVAVFAASCAMWSVMGMALSAFFPNKYIAICSPFVASYVIERLTMQLPGLLDFHKLSLSYIDNKASPIFAFSYSMGFFILISAVCGLGFYFIVRKKVQCEFN